MREDYVRKSKKLNKGKKKSAMKLFSNVPTVTQATFNLQPVNKTG